jgi:hypothetical protein
VVALRGKDIDAFLARPDPGRPIILLYGPDAGLVRERADALVASAVDDPNDPFSMVRLDGASCQPNRRGWSTRPTIPCSAAAAIRCARAHEFLPAASIRWPILRKVARS